VTFTYVGYGRVSAAAYHTHTGPSAPSKFVLKSAITHKLTDRQRGIRQTGREKERESSGTKTQISKQVNVDL